MKPTDPSNPDAQRVARLIYALEDMIRAVAARGIARFAEPVIVCVTEEARGVAIEAAALEQAQRHARAEVERGSSLAWLGALAKGPPAGAFAVLVVLDSGASGLAFVEPAGSTAGRN